VGFERIGRHHGPSPFGAPPPSLVARRADIHKRSPGQEPVSWMVNQEAISSSSLQAALCASVIAS
jgi:hypothetical protein